jgi:hypothetical protein
VLGILLGKIQGHRASLRSPLATLFRAYGAALLLFCRYWIGQFSCTSKPEFNHSNRCQPLRVI